MLEQLKQVIGRFRWASFLQQLKLARLFWWLKKGFWAVLDKGLYGGSNLLLNILLARWISQQGYGSFTVAFATLVLLIAVYNALITEPMLVYGAGRYDNQFAQYLGVLFYGHLGIGGLGSLVILLIGGIFMLADSWMLGYAFFGLALAGPFMLFGWLLRQACYIQDRPDIAAKGGGIYMGILLAAAYLLNQSATLTPLTAFAAMGGAGVVSGLWIGRKLGLYWISLRRSRLVNDVVKQHWEYGRWAVATRVPMRVPGTVVMFFLPAWIGLEAVGAFKALMNLIDPVTQVYAALGVLLVPTLSRIKEKRQFARLTHLMLLLFVAAAFAYWLLVGLFNEQIIRWIYDSRYAAYAPMLWVLAFMTVPAALAEVLNAALRAGEQPDWIFWAYTFSVSVTLPISLGLIALYGLQGAMIGSALSMAVTAAALAYYFRKFMRSMGASASQEEASQPERLPENSL